MKNVAALALVALAALACPGSDPAVLGGLEITLEVPPDQVDAVVAVQRARLAESPLGGALVDPASGGRIVVRTGRLDEDEVAGLLRLLTRPGGLEFRLVAPEAVEDMLWPEFAGLAERPIDDPERAAYEERLATEGVDTDGVRRGLRWYPGREDLGRSHRPIVLWEGDPDHAVLHFADEQFAAIGLETIPSLRPTFVMRHEDRETFADFTERRVGERVAVVYEGTVRVAPTIRDRIPGNGIIDGIDPEDARGMAAVVLGGRLPVEPRVVGQETIGPSWVFVVAVLLVLVAVPAGLCLLFVLVRRRRPSDDR